LKEPRIVTICATLVVNKNQILVIQEANKKAYGKFNIPGGHVDIDEDLKDTAIREVKEETGISIEVEDFLGVYSHQAVDKSTIIKLIFIGRPCDLEINFPKDEILNATWMDINDFLKIETGNLRSQDLFSIISDYRKKSGDNLSLVKDFFRV
jgi:ADP-ribose pyrophosphatase YjhB (NUDIX family)